MILSRIWIRHYHDASAVFNGNRDQIAANAVKKENYMQKIVLKVDGMSCEHCVKAVTDAVTGISGTADVKVDLKGGTASFSFDPEKTPLENIKAAITEEGFAVA